ncbi:interleukin-22 receptor subunit alpha-2 [Nannospalax galili]|uniref:Interleukin-22 receptor subunit alpha-2 n=1 Tax=Nannospalax galili TaxID=1026970 RepID=A0A8C6QAH5_NANGA|nr:interleukin-22 receptor subunit alpha-2 [Nannospalax galili]
MMPKLCFLGLLIKFFLTSGGETQPTHESLKPQKVRFQSRNFHNILRWQPGIMLAGNSSIYFVQYKMYGQPQWKNKQECWGTPALYCDLTNETSDLREPYYGRVKAVLARTNSDWVMTPRFTPWWETQIDPPAVTVTRVNASLLVVLHAPDLPYRGQNGSNESMENYYDLVYRVFKINKSVGKEQKVYEGAQRVVETEVLTPRSSYCVVAEIYRPILDKRSQRSKEKCVQIP